MLLHWVARITTNTNQTNGDYCLLPEPDPLWDTGVFARYICLTCFSLTPPGKLSCCLACIIFPDGALLIHLCGGEGRVSVAWVKFCWFVEFPTFSIFGNIAGGGPGVKTSEDRFLTFSSIVKADIPVLTLLYCSWSCTLSFPRELCRSPGIPFEEWEYLGLPDAPW